MQNRFLSSLAASLMLAALLHVAASPAGAQTEYKGNTLYRAQNVMSGNLVRSTFYNYGLVGNIPPAISGEWPIGTGNEYVGDVSPLVGIELVHPSGDTLHSVCTSDGPRGNPDGPPGGGMFWGFEPLPGFNAIPMIGQDPKVAMSNQDSTWPSFWPDKMYNDVRDRNWVRDDNDPGWTGKWNGYFGKNVMSADQETYFQVDDQADGEWFQRSRTNNPDTICWWDPNTVDPGESVTIYYDAITGNLPDFTSAVWMQWGVNEAAHGDWEPPPSAMWPSGTEPYQDFAVRTPMISQGNGEFRVTLSTTSDTRSLHFAFTDGEVTDSPNGYGWDIYLGEGTREFHYYPSREDSTRRGLGLRMTVRGLQWSHFLAQDCIFWLYEITNISSYTYPKACFGMMVGTLSGGRQDSEDDLAYFDVENDITYSFDSDDQGSPGWVPVRPGEINVGYVGYAFLESPGNAVDGIDNDGDDTTSGARAPVLTSSVLFPMLAPRILEVNDVLIMTDYETYARWDTVLTAEGIHYRIGVRDYVVKPGDEVMEDGRNNIDDNFNGLIDEREDHLGLRYADFYRALVQGDSSGAGLLDSMLDEARDDGIDNDGDWNPLTDDVGADGVALTGDYGEGDGVPTSGEPNFDKTDVNESDQIGLSAFEYFTPPGAVRMRDDPALWARMEPGHFDIVDPRPVDGDFIYGSGYFPLRPGQTERFSMALLYGEDLPDIVDNKLTVQQIYDQNYNFARPPDKPTLWAVPGDGQVTLYWDDRAERSYEPVCRCYDFEGYKIYRATDPGFNEVFTVTDGQGRRVFHRPVAQFDLNNGNAGFFPVIRNSVIYYLGEDTGLEHTWTDTTVENGQTYYYAVVAYDHGDVEKEILPAENSKTIVVNQSGDVTLDINTVVVRPRAPAAGYEGPTITTLDHESGSATGSVAIEMVDPRLVRDNVAYRFTFVQPQDTSRHGIAYFVARELDGVRDTLIGVRDSITANGDTFHIAEGELLAAQDALLGEAARFGAYYDSLFNLAPGTYDPARYFRVGGTTIFDGQRAYLLMPRDTNLITEWSGWQDTSRSLYGFRFQVTNLSDLNLRGKKVPADYQVEWYDAVVDTSTYLGYPGYFEYPAVPVNFRVKNLTRDAYIDFAFAEQTATVNGEVDPDEVIILFDSLAGRYEIAWSIGFEFRASAGDTVKPVGGDLLVLRIYQPYTASDVFRYGTRAARVTGDNVHLDRIKVYPNPYVAVSAQEPVNTFNEGRGERRITFIHLPDTCTVRIYTVRGELVQTLEHAATIDDGSENWDLRSRDGLNVAYGIYLYHVDSRYGTKTGRFAVIK